MTQNTHSEMATNRHPSAHGSEMLENSLLHFYEHFWSDIVYHKRAYPSGHSPQQDKPNAVVGGRRLPKDGATQIAQGLCMDRYVKRLL